MLFKVSNVNFFFQWKLNCSEAGVLQWGSLYGYCRRGQSAPKFLTGAATVPYPECAGLLVNSIKCDVTGGAGSDSSSVSEAASFLRFQCNQETHPVRDSFAAGNTLLMGRVRLIKAHRENAWTKIPARYNSGAERHLQILSTLKVILETKRE